MKTKTEFEDFCMNCEHFVMRFNKYSWSDGSKGFYEGQMHAICSKMHDWRPDKVVVDATVSKDDFENGNDMFKYDALLFDKKVPASLKEQFKKYAKSHACPLDNCDECLYHLERDVKKISEK